MRKFTFLLYTTIIFSGFLTGCSNMLEMEEGNEIGITNLFYVKLKEEKDIAQLAKLAEKNNVEIIGNHNEMPLWYIISCSKQSTGNALELANEFYATNLFEICDPELIGDFVTFGSTVFSNRTVSTDTTVSGTDIISENVTVNNRAKLTFVIGNSITINGPFTVESGSELEIRK